MFLVLKRSTLETHCTRTAQSSRIGCSRRGHKNVYLAVKKDIFCQYFTSENILRWLLSLIYPAVYLLNKIYASWAIVDTAPELWKEGDFYLNTHQEHELFKLFIEYAYFRISGVLAQWLGRRLQYIDNINYSLDYWYNALDYSNFAYSHKRVCSSAMINRTMETFILLQLFAFFIMWRHLIITNDLYRSLISMWTHFGHINSHWLARNWLALS